REHVRTGACCHRMHPRLLRWVGAHASPAQYGSCPAPLPARAIPVPRRKEGIVTAQRLTRQGLAATRQCGGLAPCQQGRAERRSGVSRLARAAAPHSASRYAAPRRHLLLATCVDNGARILYICVDTCRHADPADGARGHVTPPDHAPPDHLSAAEEA